MKLIKLLTLSFCAIAMSSVVAAQELQIEGLLVSKSDELVGLSITKDGDNYLIQELNTDHENIGILAGRVLKTDHIDILFSKDGKSARLGNEDFRHIPMDEMDIYLARVQPLMDKANCVTNIQNVQQAMRGEAEMKQLKVGDALDKSFMETFMKMPECPSGGTYSFKNKVTKKGELYCTCSHANDKDHKPGDHSDW